MSDQVATIQPPVQSPMVVYGGNAPPVVTLPPPIAQPQLAQPVAAAPAVVVVPAEPAPELAHLIHFTAYPSFVVVWPVILLGVVFSVLYGLMPDHYPERVASTLWLLSLFAVMIALGFDFDSSETAFIVMAGIVVLLALQLIAFEWQIPVFSWIGEHLKMLEVRVSANMMLVVSILLGVPYLMMLAFCRMNNYWTAVPGKLYRKTFGKSEEEIPINSTKTVNYHFYDMMMRWLCFGAGHLIVATDKGERKIGHVLWAKRRDADIEPFETMPVSAAIKHE
jgi:hypothetical protein